MPKPEFVPRPNMGQHPRMWSSLDVPKTGVSVALMFFVTFIAHVNCSSEMPGTLASKMFLWKGFRWLVWSVCTKPLCI